MKGKIIVVGGTGMLGLPVAKQLSLDQYEVSIGSTRPEEAQKIVPENIEIVPTDVTNYDSLLKAFQGKDFVYLNLNSKLDPEKYQRIEIDGTANVAKAAAESAIKRIGMISGASSRGVDEGPIFLSAKVKAENHIKASGVPYSIMRPSWFFESLPHFVQMGKAVVIGKQPTKVGWLGVDDFAVQVSNAFSNDNAANKCFFNLGPAKMTMMEALIIFCQRSHPDIEPEFVSFFNAKLASHMPGLEKLKLAIPFFEYFETMDEDVDQSETDSILGQNKMDINRWIDTHLK